MLKIDLQTRIQHSGSMNRVYKRDTPAARIGTKFSVRVRVGRRFRFQPVNLTKVYILNVKFSVLCILKY